MRIGVVTTSYPRQPGDPAGNFVAAHVHWMRGRGHDVEVICAADARAPHDSWQPGVTVTAVAAPAGLFYAGGAPEVIDAALANRAGRAGRAGMVPGVAGAVGFCGALAAAVARRARRWDAMVAHWLVPAAAAAALSPSTAPLLAIAHSGDVHLARRLGLTAPLAALLSARRARLAFVSHGLRQRFLERVWPAALRARIARASLVTPMGIDSAHFGALRGRLGHTPGERAELHILFLGRLVPIKGAHVLLDAVAELERRGLRLRVTLAGHGPERPALERRARPLHSRIGFAGEVRGAERDGLLARADLMIAPSISVSHDRTEGMPVAVLEAMAAGVPVIASRVGGMAELPDTTVELVQPGDARALAAAIERCLADPACCERRAAAATAFARDLDWDRVGARLFAGWSDLVPDRSPDSCG